jgi:hypothetical protein
MKKLKQFAPFNAQLFFSKIELQFTKVEPIRENDKTVGFKYNLLICDDQHNYGEESSLNIGEVIKVKIEDVNSNTNFTFGQKVELINPRASIYGEYQNQLSVKADDVIVKKSK